MVSVKQLRSCIKCSARPFAIYRVWGWGSSWPGLKYLPVPLITYQLTSSNYLSDPITYQLALSGAQQVIFWYCSCFLPTVFAFSLFDRYVIFCFWKLYLPIDNQKSSVGNLLQILPSLAEILTRYIDYLPACFIRLPTRSNYLPAYFIRCSAGNILTLFLFSTYCFCAFIVW